jgi:subtilisin family serine protease
MMSPTLKPGWKPSPRPRPAAETTARTGFPRALAASAVVWLALAFLTLWAGMNALGNDPDQRNTQDLDNQLGEGTVAASTHVHPQDVLALVVGVCVLTALGFLLLGRKWAQYALYASSVAAVVVLALGGHWEAAVVFLAFVIGAITLFAESAQAYLRR